MFTNPSRREALVQDLNYVWPSTPRRKARSNHPVPVSVKHVMKPVANLPKFEEVLDAIREIEQSNVEHARVAQRFDITIPGEVETKDGRNIPVRLRDLSPTGIGLFHYGALEVGEVTVTLAVNSYSIALKWCVHVKDKLYMSGGPILRTRPTRELLDV